MPRASVTQAGRPSLPRHFPVRMTGLQTSGDPPTNISNAHPHGPVESPKTSPRLWIIRTTCRLPSIFALYILFKKKSCSSKALASGPLRQPKRSRPDAWLSFAGSIHTLVWLATVDFRSLQSPCLCVENQTVLHQSALVETQRHRDRREL